MTSGVLPRSFDRGFMFVEVINSAAAAPENDEGRMQRCIRPSSFLDRVWSGGLRLGSEAQNFILREGANPPGDRGAIGSE
jgi:hypothetical protein